MTSWARKSGTKRTDWRASASMPPSSRSTTQTAVVHSRPSDRSASTALAAAPPLVTTSSTRQTSSPAEYSPSTRRAVPYSFSSFRTIRKGRPDASEAAAVRATAPSSGPASRTAPGATAATLEAIRSPRARSRSRLGLEPVFVQVVPRAASRAQDEVALEVGVLPDEPGQLCVGHPLAAASALRASGRRRSPRRGAGARTRPRSRPRSRGRRAHATAPCARAGRARRCPRRRRPQPVP